MQPIHNADLAKITLEYMRQWSRGAQINVSGKTTISINRVVDILMEQADFKCRTFHIPIWLVRLCKWVMPFDVDGYTEDRIAAKGTNIKVGTSDIVEDIKNIITAYNEGLAIE